MLCCVVGMSWTQVLEATTVFQGKMVDTIFYGLSEWCVDTSMVI